MPLMRDKWSRQSCEGIAAPLLKNIFSVPTATEHVMTVTEESQVLRLGCSFIVLGSAVLALEVSGCFKAEAKGVA